MQSTVDIWLHKVDIVEFLEVVTSLSHSCMEQ